MQDGKYMRLRFCPCVLRIHASRRKPGHEEHYSEMLLYLPWRDEIEDLLANDEIGCIQLYETCKNVIIHNKTRMFPFATHVEIMEKIIESNENERPQHAFDTLDPLNQHENLEDMEVMPPLDTSELPDEAERTPSKDAIIPESVKFKRVILDDEEDMRRAAQTLSYEQRVIFDKIVNYCKEVVMSRGNQTFEPDPPRIIAHGKKIK